ncbi:MAG: ABC transporter ATP-binding protein [Candidatus Sumerlaeota bacterium]|nr:ABC transporter ATP-binding protein [Candidatus Sumerlaeota bacterium]
MTEKKPLLQAIAITKTFRASAGGLHVLEPITLDVAHGEFVGIVGPSGCGKTTFLRILAGIETPDNGTVSWDVKESDDPIPISFAFQHLALFPWRTVEGNVRFPLGGNRAAPDICSSVAELINAFGLQGFEKFYPAQLSGGMRQRVALARALITQPKLLILDEPFGALDVYARMKLQDLILENCGSNGISLLMVTHDLHEAVRLCERVIVLSERPAHVIGVIETSHWSKTDRQKITPVETAPFVEKLHQLLRANSL